MAPAFLSRLSPIPQLPQHTGPYHVGTIDIEVPIHELPHHYTTSVPDERIKTVAFRLFYPCDPQSTRSKGSTAYWMPDPQHANMAGFMRFCGAGNGANLFAALPNVMKHITLSAHSNAPLLQSPTSTGQWPAVVFSHGLGGMRNTYSSLCSSLASHGLVVAAPEHRDGSAPITHIAPVAKHEKAPGTAIDYTRFSHTPSDQVYAARDDQLRVRLWELGLLCEALKKIADGQPLTNLRPESATPRNALAQFRGQFDFTTPGKVTFAGHSFGAATTTQLVKSAYWSVNAAPSCAAYSDKLRLPSLYIPTSEAVITTLVTPTTPTILLDLWSLPLRSPFNNLAAYPMPAFDPCNAQGGSSVLAILSSAFAAWRENLDGLLDSLRDPYASNHSATTSRSASISASSQHAPSLQAPSAVDSGIDVISVNNRDDDRSDDRDEGYSSGSGSPKPRFIKREKAHVFYPEKSAHLSQSDFGVLFPRLTKWFAKGEDPERTIKLNVRACVELLRRSSFEVKSRPSKELHVDTNKAPVHIQVEGEEEEGDWRILSTKKGLVRGWITVDIDRHAADTITAEEKKEETPSRRGSFVEDVLGDDKASGAANAIKV